MSRNLWGSGAIFAAASGAAVLLLSLTSLVSYKVGVVVLLAAGAMGVMSRPSWRRYAFTAWVLACVGAALTYPGAFHEWGGVRLTVLIVPLVQVIMFGMGSTLSAREFVRVAAAPWPIVVGMVLQFSVMPVVGFLVALGFGFEGELAAGIVLIGACSGGVASNLMTYLARGNVALSVTMTCISTMAAPIMTPLLMKLFAGAFVPIDAVAMMISILNMIIMPVAAGLIAHSVLYSLAGWARRGDALLLIVAAAAVIAAGAWVVSGQSLGRLAGLRSGLMVGGSLIAAVTAAKLVINVMLGRSSAWMDRALPLVSMAGICVVLTIIIAQTHDVLMAVGATLWVAAMIHNGAGYLLGYWGTRGGGVLLGRVGYRLGLLATPGSIIDESACRTVAFEVGMQNGGMATGLAIDVLKSHVAALPPNLFGTWMNISGSILANWWKDRLPVAAVSHARSARGALARGAAVGAAEALIPGEQHLAGVEQVGISRSSEQ